MFANMHDAYQEWRFHPITKALLENVQTDKGTIQGAWSEGSFLKHSDIENAHEAGMVEALDMLESAIESGEFVIEE